MKYPNLRFGNPQELGHYAQGMPLAMLAKRLRRNERTVKDWLSGVHKVPFWVPELIRLQNMEQENRLYQMNIRPTMARLGLVNKTAILYEFPRPESPQVEYIDNMTLPLFATA
jgi:hypothetical protein